VSVRQHLTTTSSLPSFHQHRQLAVCTSALLQFKYSKKAKFNMLHQNSKSSASHCFITLNI
jgi:hypothetical protein